LIIIFGKFLANFRLTQIGCFLQNQCFDLYFESKSTNLFSEIFSENIFKIITLTPETEENRLRSGFSSQTDLQVFGHGVVEHVQLEVADAHAVAPVVVNVLGPCTAFNVKQLARVGVLELHCHQGALVVLLVLVGKVVGGEAPGVDFMKPFRPKFTDKK
jgi:hypothetical protein